MKTRPPRTWVKMVSPQFIAAVEKDAKRQTVRPLPKNGVLPKVGDRISLRAWTGAPYRSKQRVLREGVIVDVERCCVRVNGVDLELVELRDHLYLVLLNGFAVMDGFADWSEMKAWFLATHKTLPFHGVLIAWRPDAR